jgi:lipopolysaccharide heptosyltransferase II
MQNVSKILLMRFSSMGDIILTSPLIRVLRLQYPTAQIDFFTKEQFADLVRYNPHLSSIISLKTDGKKELTDIATSLRKTRYDVLLDLHNSIRSGYIRRYINPKRLSVIDKHVVARFFLVNFKWNFYKGIVPVATRYLETGKFLNLEDDGKGLEIFFPEIVNAAAAKAFNGFIDNNESVIGLSPTAKHLTKIWQSEKFIELGIRIAAENTAKILVFGGPTDVQYCENIAAKINSGSGKNVALNCAGKFSILETAAAIDRCSLVVTNDSGIMHIASARKKKIIAIFGSTVEEFGFFPDRRDSIIIENKALSCRPCTHIGRDRCPKGHFRCMAEITVDDVLNAARTLLPRPMESRSGIH